MQTELAQVTNIKIPCEFQGPALPVPRPCIQPLFLGGGGFCLQGNVIKTKHLPLLQAAEVLVKMYPALEAMHFLSAPKVAEACMSTMKKHVS